MNGRGNACKYQMSTTILPPSFMSRAGEGSIGNIGGNQFPASMLSKSSFAHPTRSARSESSLSSATAVAAVVGGDGDVAALTAGTIALPGFADASPSPAVPSALKRCRGSEKGACIP